MFKIQKLQYKNILNIENLIIPHNKITCIIGESGSGKTTLLRMLNKLISPDKGTIFYNKIPLTEMDSIELRRQVVMLPQSPGIFKGTIKDNLLIGLEFSEKPMVSDEELTKILEIVNLKKALDNVAEKLSGGEKQRLALGRIILMNPDVLLLDEPSSALDEDTELMIIEKLVTYCKERDKTLIMVTHSKKIAHTFGDTLIKIKNGEIVNQEEV